MPFNPIALIGQAAGDMYAQSEGNKARKREAERARAHDINMWDKTNFYNDPKQQMERLRSAGLNPNMVYGGSSGQTAGQANALPGAKAPDIKNIETRQPLMDYVTVKNTEAQTENVRSMQNLNDANAYKTYDDILSNEKNRSKTDEEIANLIELRDGIKSDNKTKNYKALLSEQGRIGNENAFEQEWNRLRLKHPNLSPEDILKKVSPRFLEMLMDMSPLKSIFDPQSWIKNENIKY